MALLKLKERDKRLISILNDTLNFLDDFINNIKKHYIAKFEKQPFRFLCFGYLKITQNNLRAIVTLAENNIIDQIQYITRNILEMVVTLYYLGNGERDKLANRFLYFEKVFKYKFMKAMEEHPRLFKVLLDEGKIEEKEEEFEIYKRDYGLISNHINSWSAKNLFEMIDNINDEADKKHILKCYRIMAAWDKSFMHPTEQYLKQLFEIKPDSVDFYNYKNIRLVYTKELSDLIIKKCFNRFSKSRIAPTEKFNALKIRQKSYKEFLRNNNLE